MSQFLKASSKTEMSDGVGPHGHGIIGKAPSQSFSNDTKTLQHIPRPCRRLAGKKFMGVVRSNEYMIIHDLTPSILLLHVLKRGNHHHTLPNTFNWQLREEFVPSAL